MFFLLLPVSAGGQALYMKHFTVDDGLPSNEVYQVLQDSSGKLLLATDRGGVQFDGYGFRPVLQKNRLTSKPVYYIYQSPENEIYFSSLQGIIYQYRNETLYDFPFNNRTASLFYHPGILIANTISVHADTTWISFNNDYNYNYKIGSCFVTAEGAVKKIDDPDGLYFDLRRNFFYRQTSPESNSVQQQPLTIYWENGKVSNDNVTLNWRGSYIRRLFHLRCGAYDLFSVGRQLLIYKDQKKVGNFLFPEHVLSISQYNNEEFYVGFENKGAALYRLQEGTIIGPLENHLDGYSVSSIYKDNQGGTWFSTLENGVFYSHPAQTRLWDSQSRIVSIERAKFSDRVYVGYYNGLLQTFSGNRIIEESYIPLPAGSYLLRMFLNFSDSLVALTDKGYFIKEQGHWRNLPGQDILLLFAGKDTVYGTPAPTAELRIYEGLGKPLRQKLPLSKRIISMFAGRSGVLWIGTWEGLVKYENGQLTDQSALHPVFNDRIIGISELSTGELVVASLSNGIAVYKNNRIVSLNASNGLRSPTVNTMTVHKDTIWIGSNKGLTMVRYKDNRFRTVHLGLESGIPSLDVQQFTVNNGWIYSKWVNKLVVINASRILHTDSSTRTTITTVKVNDSLYFPPIERSFRHNQNALAFDFTCINLAAARQQQFTYRLEGFDDAWHHTMEQSVKYTNLPPGQYRFLVRAINLKDQSHSAVSAYSFQIQPAFWQQWWFPPLVFSLVICLLLLLFQMRLRAIRKKNTLLLELAENRQKILVQLIHPHFVFNLMNTIQGAVLKEDKLVAASLIARLARLMRLSLEVSKDKWVSLAKELDLLTKYFELEEIRSPGRFEYRIETAPSIQTTNVFVPSMVIQPFVENAIKHGVGNLTTTKGFIHILLKEENGALICVVDDNGVGRKQAALIRQTTFKEHQSSGIEITIDRLRLLHQEQETNFFYEVIDKANEQGESKGTTIKFSIPFKQNV
ncbi:histidine kinase [Flavisolibacter sp. BT320]|nr:histidine kinase [Flavisolibacter longurius]